MAEIHLSDDSQKTKVCSICKITKPWSEFYFDKRNGLPICQCKPCRSAQTAIYQNAHPEKVKKWSQTYTDRHKGKRAQQQREYRARNPEQYLANARVHNKRKKLKSLGITEADLQAAEIRQNGVCAICQIPGRISHYGGRLVIDHCHKTNVFRGLLCSECNTSLGKFMDDIDILRRAITYVETQGKMFDEAAMPSNNKAQTQKA